MYDLTTQAAGASSYILDLRNNPGGLVRASIDVARLWLDGSPVVFNISGREVRLGSTEQLGCIRYEVIHLVLQDLPDANVIFQVNIN